jgi:mono/diheme cytochrome c family protein
MAMPFDSVAAKAREHSSLLKLSAAMTFGLFGLAAAFVTINDARAQATSGEQIFTTVGCSGCHSTDGHGSMGGDAPALAGNGDLADANKIINQILNGGGGMPAFSGQLSNDQIAAVANYIRNAWGNSNPTQIQAADVAALRQ